MDGEIARDRLDRLRAMYVEWARGDFTGHRDLFDRDFVFRLRPEFPDAGVYHGPEGMAEYLRLFLAAWTDLTITAGEFTEAGDSVVVAVHQRGAGRESGIGTELQYWQVWTFRGQKVVRLEAIRERADALATVGL